MINTMVQKLKNSMGDKKNPRNELFNELQKIGFDSKKAKQILLGGKFDINEKDENSQTFLHIFARQNNGEAITWLIKNGADVSILNGKNQTPLHISILSNAKFAVIALLNSGINIDTKTTNGKTLFQELICISTPVIAESLIVKTTDINHIDDNGRNALFDAVVNGSIEIISMIAKNKDIEKNLIDNDGNTILHLAQSINNPQIAIKLIENGSNPMITDRTGKSHLYYILKNGFAFSNVFRLSKDMGFDLNTNILGQNLLHHLIILMDDICETDKQKCQDLFKLMIELIKLGIDINSRNEQLETPLILAARSKNMLAFSGLLKLSEISVDAVDINGVSALHHISCKQNSLEFVELMLAKGAKIKSSLEQTNPLHFTIMHKGDKKVVLKFLEIEKIARAQDSKGRNILHMLALYNNEIDYYKMIILNYADLATKVDIYGILPIEYAILRKNFELAVLLSAQNIDIKNDIKKNIVLIELEICNVNEIFEEAIAFSKLLNVVQNMRQDFCLPL